MIVSGPPRCNRRNGAQKACSESVLQALDETCLQSASLLAMTLNATVATQSAEIYAHQTITFKRIPIQLCELLVFLREPNTMRMICKERLSNNKLRISHKFHSFLSVSGLHVLCSSQMLLQPLANK